MMDLENPSYFSVEAEMSPFEMKPLLRMESGGSGSDCSLSRQLTPPRGKYAQRFLRSISSNSADSSQDLFLRGEPRTMDIAPDIVQKRNNSRSNSLKSRPKPEFNNDFLYGPLPTTEENMPDGSGDEVFIGEDSVKYYNFPSARETRRHSVSAFISRERSNSMNSTMSFKEEFPQGEAVASSSCVPIDDHSLRHASFPRKRCNRCTKGPTHRVLDMEDILIVFLKSSNAAVLWVEYFTTYFQQISKQANRKPFRIKCLDIEDIVDAKEDVMSLEERAGGVKLQLAVVCPGFLEYVSEYSERLECLGRILLPDRVLALLLGVSDIDITEFHKRVIPNYFQWKRLAVGQDQDENFTKEFLSQAMSILSKIWKQQCSVVNQEKSCFSVSPKKIRQGQNTIFIILTYPLQKDDTLKVSIERNNELIEVKSVKRRNPYTIKITVPDTLTEVSAIVNILVEKNGSIIGSRPIKCESKLRELEQILRSCNNPVEFMCQSLACSDNNKEQLDNWLTYAFQKNVPAHFNLLINHSTPFAASAQVHKHGYAEFPTLLHFAAKFGLEKLTLHLLDCPGADTAYELRNVFNMTPIEIAEANGHKDLSNTLRSYINMNEFTSTYSKLKEISQKCHTTDSDGYLTPKSLEQFYKICPPPRPVLDRIQPTTSNENLTKSTIVTPTSEYNPTTSDYNTTIGYMTMHSNVIPKPQNDPSKIEVVVEINTAESENKPVKETITKDCNSPQKTPENKSCVYEDEVQRELLEIINDYKNNVHSISQVEKLVDEWKNRNDVQKSFKEKQEQLKEMRLKYEKIQHDMKAAMRKPTPFDRVKRLFSRRMPEEKQEISSPVPNANSSVQRPVSSLSISSSESSGRMSTISGSSLVDSGTHSDNEERKSVINSHNEDEFRNELNKAVLELNYSAVPAPKPVKTGILKNTVFETIEERPVTRPDSLPLENNEYYIHFPPSGLPVPGLVDEKSKENKSKNSSAEYMNISPNSDLPPTHEYMNFKISTFR